ncbi:MAG: hypothetical protein EOO22_24310 [Comamonadaceae bacterium]|nr:MAG: hypothetical protein EOO22_24310 [Comamonadaceae bacterium]
MIREDDPLTPEEESSNAAMRRALQHAPDHAATPDWRIRRAIQQRARKTTKSICSKLDTQAASD